MSDPIQCTRCSASFDNEDELMLHSIEQHTNEPISPSDQQTAQHSTTVSPDSDDLDPAVADRVLELLEERARASDSVFVQYGQTYLVVASLSVVAIVAILSYLFINNLIGVGVYMFSLGVLFGLAVSYLQGFVQSTWR